MNTGDTEVNYGIKADSMLVIDYDGTSLGMMTKKAAMYQAVSEGYDLVRVGGKDQQIPVCKIMDFGKYKFDKEKKERLAKKKNTKCKCSEIQITYTTAEHDLETKTNMIKKLIAKGHDVQLVLRLRGRETAMIDGAKDKINHLAKMCDDFASIKTPLDVNDRDLSILLTKKK